MESKEIYFMNLALEQATLALHPDSEDREPEVPVGCVFVLSETSEVIGKGFNSTNIEQNATRHAELVAIDDIIFNQNRSPEIFKNCELYVTCEPCIMCAAALGKLNIKKVYFGCSNERFGGTGSVLNVHKDSHYNGSGGYEVIGGILKDESIALFQEFYALENNRAPLDKRKRKIRSDISANESFKRSELSPKS